MSTRHTNFLRLQGFPFAVHMRVSQGLPPIEPPPPVPPFEVQDRFRREFCHAATGWPRAGALSRFPHSAERLNDMVGDVEVRLALTSKSLHQAPRCRSMLCKMCR